MFLWIRMALYMIFGALSGTGIGLNFDPASGLVSFNIDMLANIIVGAVGFVATVWASRIAKRRGGNT